jgi:hypothetical protein
VRRVVERSPQRAAGREIARFDDNQPVSGRISEKTAKNRTLCVGNIAYPDQSAAARKADLRRLVVKPRWVGGQRGTGQVGYPERVAQIGDDGPAKGVGALAHESSVEAVQQHGASLKVGAAEEIFDLAGRQPHDAAMAFF